MKRGRWILLALLVVFAFPVALYAKDANPAAVAKAKVTEFTGTENLEALVYKGDFTFTPGGAWRVRDRKWEGVHKTTDPRVTGDVIIVVNCNKSPNDTGHCWGTMHVEPDDFEGAWEATWHSPEGRPEISAVGYGTGELEGLKAWWTFMYYGDVGYISGRILDPQGD